VKLDDGAVHIWLAYDAEMPAQAYSRFQLLLTPEERARCERFRTQELRHQYLLARAVLRQVLSGYVPQVQPMEWSFSRGEYDKPELAAPFAVHGLHFNLTHAPGLVALAVGRSALGIDVENCAVRDPPLEVVRSYFTALEAEALEALDPAARAARFFALWTLKESWLKADGRGLSAGLENVEFTLDAGHRVINVRLAADDARLWSFQQWWPSPEHVMALGVRREALTAAPPQVELRRFVPAPTD
jgi:4'-phosphopantetheinyl transferase